jgi:hypothetical protein
MAYHDRLIAYIKAISFMLIVSISMLFVTACIVASVTGMWNDISSCNQNSCNQLSNACEKYSCTVNGCKMTAKFDGCCVPGMNCTVQSSTANYAFNKVCALSISQCDI